MLWRVDFAALQEVAWEVRQTGEIGHCHHQIFPDEAYWFVELVDVKLVYT
jgi:hypothetical protein